MNAVEFVIRMRDQASTTLDRIGREFGSAKIKADTLGGALDGASTKAGRLGRSLKDAFMSIPGASFLMNPFVLAGAGVAAIGKLGMENEKASVSFEVLLQSGEKAKAMLGEINKFADTTPFEKMGLRDAAKMMLSFGISQEKIMPTMKMLGDVAMGDKEKLNQMTLAYSQMASAGKLQGQDLLQMINAGFNPMNEISKMTGKSMGDLRKEMEQGRISSDMVEKAFIHATSAGGLFYGMTEKMGKSAGGKLSTMIDSAKNRLLELYGVIEPILVPAIDIATQGLNLLSVPINWLVTGMTWLFKQIKEGNPLIYGLAFGIGAFTLATNAASIATAAISLGTKIWAGAQWLLNIAMNANPLTWIITLIVAVGAAVYVAYQKVGWFRGIILGSWEAIKGFGKLLKEFVLDRITGIISGIGKLGKSLLLLFKGDFKQAWATAKDAGKDIIGVGSITNAITNAKAIGTATGAAYQKGIEQVAKSKSKSTKIIPGTNVAYGMTTPGANGGSNTGATQAANAVATGGTKNTSISINLRSMVENLVYNGGAQENKDDLVKVIEEAMSRLLAIAAATA